MTDAGPVAFVEAVEAANAPLKRGNVRPCLEIHLYGTQPRGEFKDALVAALEIAERHLPGTFTYWRSNTMSSSRPVGADAGVLMGNFVTADAMKPAKVSGMEFFGGEKPTQFKLPSVDWFSTRLTPGPGIPPTRSYLRVCVPHDGEFSDPKALRALVHELLKGFPLLAGHCGWTYYTGGGFSDAEAAIAKDMPGWLLRYPGVSVGEPLGQANLIVDGLLAVSWLNFVSEAFAAQRGQDLAALAKAAKSCGVGAEMVAPGVLELQAGPTPETGDVERQDLVPAYGEAGAMLAPFAMAEDRAKYQTIVGMDFETRVRWYRRFFDETPRNA